MDAPGRDSPNTLKSMNHKGAKVHEGEPTLSLPELSLALQVFRFAADSTDVGNTSGGQAVARARAVDVRPLRYVARQPIFDRDEKVFGYELLFRDGLENAFHSDSNEASRATLDRTLLMGLDVLCDGRIARGTR